MKNSIFTVPDGFFEESEKKALKAADTIRKRRNAFAGIVCGIALFVVAGFLFIPNKTKTDLLDDYIAQEIMDTYDCDIFIETYQF